MQNKHPIRLKTTFLVSLLILAASIIVGYLALVAIFALPLKEDAQCHERTVKTLYDEGLYPSDIYLWRNIDNWSDSYSFLSHPMTAMKMHLKKLLLHIMFKQGITPMTG